MEDLPTWMVYLLLKMVGFFQCYMLVDPSESFFCGRRYRRCPWSVAFPGAEALVLEDWDPRNVRNHEDSDDTYLGNRLAVVSSDQVICCLYRGLYMLPSYVGLTK